MAPARLDLTGKQGDTFKRTLRFSEDGALKDVSAYTFLAQIKRFEGDRNTPLESFAITRPDNFSLILRLEADETSSLKARNYSWDMQWVTPGNDTETIFEGVFILTPQTTIAL